jgi:hypothetical protein
MSGKNSGYWKRKNSTHCFSPPDKAIRKRPFNKVRKTFCSRKQHGSEEFNGKSITKISGIPDAYYTPPFSFLGREEMSNTVLTLSLTEQGCGGRGNGSCCCRCSCRVEPPEDEGNGRDDSNPGLAISCPSSRQQQLLLLLLLLLRDSSCCNFEFRRDRLKHLDRRVRGVWEEAAQENDCSAHRPLAW